MEKEIVKIKQTDSNPFGLREFDFSIRVPEKSEMFIPSETKAYIEGCDYPESADDLLLAWEMEKLFGINGISKMRILDAMCGPGRLGREFLSLGTKRVVFQDGDKTMIKHAKDQAFNVIRSGQKVDYVQSDVANIPFPDESFDLVISHNATHQLSSINRLHIVMKEFLRVTSPGGHMVIADYQRATTPEFLKALEDRLQWTKPEIVPLLTPSFFAAFSKEEFKSVLRSIPNIKNWSVVNAKQPDLSRIKQERVEQDFVKGHLMDYSPISLRVIVQRGEK